MASNLPSLLEHANINGSDRQRHFYAFSLDIQTRPFIHKYALLYNHLQYDYSVVTQVTRFLTEEGEWDSPLEISEISLQTLLFQRLFLLPDGLGRHCSICCSLLGRKIKGRWGLEMGLCNQNFCLLWISFLLGIFSHTQKATVLICSGVDSKVVLYKESFARCYQLPLTLQLENQLPSRCCQFHYHRLFYTQPPPFLLSSMSHSLCCLQIINTLRLFVQVDLATHQPRCQVFPPPSFD